MARGKYYTKDENERILAVCDDNIPLLENKRYKEIAEKCHKFGICEERNLDSLSQQISKLLKARTEDVEEEEETVEEMMIADIQNEFDEFKEKYNSLIKVLIDDNTKVNNGYLQFNFPAITKWLRENETKRYWSRVSDINAEVKS